MRLFFALVPDAALRAALRERALAMASQIGGRAVPPANLHLTLAFLGDIEPGRVAALETIHATIPTEPFTLTLDRVGEWHHAGVAWIAPAEVPRLLAALHAQLNTALAAEGFARESRPFRPHVTLVRRRARPLADAACEPLAWRVVRVALMLSERIGSAIRYREHEVGAR